MTDLSKKYNAIYSSKPEYGLGQPNKIVVDATKYKTRGDALDLGCGMGRNSLYLASAGFNVTAIDLSEVGIEYLRESLAQKNLSAETIVADIKNIAWDKNYDLVVSVAMLFHQPPKEAIALIENIQEHTTVGGLNAISTFTQDSDFYRNEPDADEYYPEAEELKKLYLDWEILEYEEIEVKAGDKRPGKGGSPVTNTAATILARKLR